MPRDNIERCLLDYRTYAYAQPSQNNSIKGGTSQSAFGSGSHQTSERKGGSSTPARKNRNTRHGGSRPLVQSGRVGGNLTGVSMNESRESGDPGGGITAPGGQRSILGVAGQPSDSGTIFLCADVGLNETTVRIITPSMTDSMTFRQLGETYRSLSSRWRWRRVTGIRFYRVSPPAH